MKTKTSDTMTCWLVEIVNLETMYEQLQDFLKLLYFEKQIYWESHNSSATTTTENSMVRLEFKDAGDFLKLNNKFWDRSS